MSQSENWRINELVPIGVSGENAGFLGIGALLDPEQPGQDDSMMRMENLGEPCEDAYCVPPPLILPAKPAVDRRPLIREAFRLEWLTIGWMVIQAVVATAAGVASGSLVLIAFGLDSVVELISVTCAAFVLRNEWKATPNLARLLDV